MSDCLNGMKTGGGHCDSSTDLRAQTLSSSTSNTPAIFPLEISERTIVVLAVCSDEERGALKGCTGRAELLYLGDVGREGGRVAIGLLRRGGVDVGVHGGEAATPTMRTKRDRGRHEPETCVRQSQHAGCDRRTSESQASACLILFCISPIDPHLLRHFYAVHSTQSRDGTRL